MLPSRIHLKFSKNKVPIPDTQMALSTKGFKSLANRFYPKGYAVVKSLGGYGGDGVFRTDGASHTVNVAAKFFWKNDYSLYQEFVKDSFGRSVRVLLFNGKTVAVVEYIDTSNNFKSNANYGLEFKSLMDDERYNEYAALGEKAAAAIGENLTTAGVDILNSKEKGLVVLEVNGWPDFGDIDNTTQMDTFKMFGEVFVEKVKKFKKKLI